MIDCKIQLGTSGYLELDSDIPVSLNFSIAEIQDISKKNASFSKTVYIPGTKNNHQLMGHYFEVNLSDGTFDINRKNTCIVFSDGLPVLKGYIQLLSVKKLSPTSVLGDEKISYEVLLFDSKTNFYDKLGNELLEDLDLSRFNHNYYYTTILGSSGNTYQDGFVYPLYNNPSTAIYETADFRPSIFVRTYIDQLFQEAGYTYTSAFFDSAFFKRLVIPYNGDFPQLTFNATRLREFQASMSGTPSTYLRTSGPGGISANTLSALTQTVNANSGYKIPYNDDSDITVSNFDSGGTFSTTLYRWTCPNFGIYDFNVSFNGTFLWSAATNGWRFSDNPGIPNGGVVPNTTLDGICYLLKNGTVVASTNVNNIGFTPTRTYYGLTGPQGISTSFGPDLSANTQYSFSFSLYNWISTLGTPNALLVPGDYVEVKFKLNNPYMDYYKDGYKYSTWTGTTGLPGNNINGSGWPANSNKINVTCSLKFSTTPSINNRFYNTAHSNGVLSDLDTVNIQDFIPKKIQKKQFFAGLVSLFNLYIEQDPENETNLIIKTRDEFYSGSTALDWTYKISQDREQNIKFLSELQNKKLIFTYTQDDNSPRLKDYKARTNFVYGEFDVEFDNDFLTGDKTIQPLFAPTVIANNYNGNIVSDIDSRAPKNTIRILYCSPGLFSSSTVSTWQYKYLQTGSTSAFYTTTTQNGYVFAGHYDNPIYPTLDLNYGTNQDVYYNELSGITNNTLYYTYWFNYVSQIANGKLLTGYFNLTARDILNLRFTDKIFIKDAFYYINKIIDWNAVKPDLTKVELIKVDDGLRNPANTVRRTSVINMGGPQNNYTSTARAASTGGMGSSGSIVEGGNYAFSLRSGVVLGNENTIQGDVTNNIVSGQRNTVGSSNGVVILNGTGNTVAGDNVIMINTSNKTITESNVIYINGMKIKDGVIYPLWNDIDSGSNSAYDPFSNYTENNIDSGLNAVRNGGSVSPVNGIESGEDSTNS